LKINAEKIPTITEASDPKHIDFEKLQKSQMDLVVPIQHQLQILQYH